MTLFLSIHFASALKQILRFSALAFFNYSLASNWSFSDKTSWIKLNGPNASIKLETPLNDFSGGIISSQNYCLGQIQTDSPNNQIFLDGGAVVDNLGSFAFKGSINLFPERSYSISGNTVCNISEVVHDKIFVSGLNNFFLGSPVFLEKITLQDQNSELILGLTGSLSKNIVLNGGKIKLQKDLYLEDEIVLEGNGLLDLNSYVMYFSANHNSSWTGNLTFHNAKNLSIFYPVKLTGNWTFEGDAGYSNIVGGGTIFKLEPGSLISVGPNHHLHITSLHLKGLSDITGGAFDIHPTSTISFRFCTLELAHSLTVGSGSVLFDADGCGLVTRKEDRLIVDSNQSFLLVDGVFLRCDSLNSPGIIPIHSTNGGNVVRLNDGDFIPGTMTLGIQEVIMNLDSSLGENEINMNISLSSNRKIIFKNDQPNVRKSMILNGNGNKISFIEGNLESFVLEDNIDLEVRNIVFDNFDFKNFSLHGSDSQKSRILLGNNTQVFLRKDVISLGDNIVVGGDVYFNGSKHLLSLSPSNLILLSNANLTLDFLRLEFATTIDYCRFADTSTLTLKDSVISLTGASNMISAGNVEIKGDCKLINSSNNSLPSANSSLVFNSKGIFQVCTLSSFYIGDDMTFSYDPNTDYDADAQAKKRHFLMESPNSCLGMGARTKFLCGPGIIFDKGIFNIDGPALMEASTQQGQELELYDELTINIDKDFALAGLVVYT